MRGGGGGEEEEEEDDEEEEEEEEEIKQQRKRRRRSKGIWEKSKKRKRGAQRQLSLNFPSPPLSSSLCLSISPCSPPTPLYLSPTV